ncbi:MAG: hypothetical protein M3T96_10535 [Acidobacteriota bacterium]|nr:hypothetical protein [Acidobacteriota bacterium]
MLEKLLALPIKEKIGQLFIIGLPDPELNADTKEFLRDIAPGGVCLFARNIKEAAQTRKLLDDIREILPVEPILSLDQEGGLVDRLRRVTAPMPAPSSLKTLAEVESLAAITAEIAEILGFNMNFAPVVDVIDESRGKSFNGLYSRTFGTSKAEVVELAGAYLAQLQAHGCLGCLKHFPGLGASEVDSHEELPVVYLTREELFEIDLLPYRRLIPTGEVHSIMVAHAAFPRFDLQETDENGKLLPSSLSYNIVTKLLREELNYENLVITDDLEMGAIIKNYGIGEACKRAIAAGVDLLAICASPEAIVEGCKAVTEAVKNGDLSETRIDESLKHIARAKSLLHQPPPFDAARLQTLSDEIARLGDKSISTTEDQ